jgi:hypothetical protein
MFNLPSTPQSVNLSIHTSNQGGYDYQLGPFKDASGVALDLTSANELDINIYKPASLNIAQLSGYATVASSLDVTSTGDANGFVTLTNAQAFAPFLANGNQQFTMQVIMQDGSTDPFQLAGVGTLSIQYP